jgi:hypothetical protein
VGGGRLVGAGRKGGGSGAGSSQRRRPRELSWVGDVLLDIGFGALVGLDPDVNGLPMYSARVPTGCVFGFCQTETVPGPNPLQDPWYNVRPKPNQIAARRNPLGNGYPQCYEW